MVTFIIRLLKRVSVLVPGVIVTYLALKNVFPEVSDLLPFEPAAIFATYILIAYIFIPTVIRFIRLIAPPKHLPYYCTTPDGFASDPVNIGVYATREELIVAMGKAGWFVADRRTPRTILKLFVALIQNKSYVNAPFSNLYLFGRNQDIGFEMPVGGSPRHRHHVRFWAASHTGDPRHLDHLSFWDNFQRSNLLDGRVLWVGAASLDIGIGIIRHNAQLTHMIHENTDKERDLITSSLKATGLVQKVRQVDASTEPYWLRNRVFRGRLKSDGKLTICEITPDMADAKKSASRPHRLSK
ncbi:MAG: LssY C-terminal domain-containing protein [Candidatus Saccharibacteria bacterium]|nr:LssY C-terminal domain-containing protein [Candidatus Saccharibacteria bacterium]